jgi:iron complex outermembrane receptor protein
VDTYRPEFSIGKARFEGTATLVYGENASSLDAYARLGGATPQFRWTASGNVRSAGDYTDGDDQPVAAGYDSDNWRWGIGGKLADDVTLDYAGGYQEQRDVEYPGRILDATYFKTLSHALELRWRPPSGYLAELYGQAYLNDKTHEMNNDEKPTAQADPDRTPPFPLEIVLPTTSDTSGARFYAVLGRQRLQWKVGTDYYGLDQTATREVSNRDTGAVLFEDIVWPDATTMDLGLYGQVTWTATRYQVTGIVRGDFVDSDAGETSQFFLDSTQGDLDRSDTNLSAAVSGSVNLSKHWTLEAGAGRAVRSPTHLELYSDRFPAVKFQTSAEFLGNPELEPEVSLQGDAGVRATYGSFDFSVDGFWRRIDDYITVVPDPDVPKRLPLSPDTVFRYINGEATFYGGELRLSQVLRSGFGYRGWASYVHGQDDLLDEPALGIPPLMGEVAISYRKAGVRGFWIELGMLMAARQERVATTRFETETSGWTVFNLRTTWDVSGVVQVVAGIDNLANRQYSDHLNALDPFQGGRIPAQGRNFYIGLNFFF